MTATILCPGPSLPRTYDGSRHGLVLGVNRAAIVYPCDVWCAMDLPFIRAVREQVIGSPQLLTSVAVIDRLQLPNTIAVETLWKHYPQSLSFALYTATAALVFAHYLGAKSVNVYGADWSDAPDFDGVTLESNNRGEDRWAREREIWNGVVSHIGIQVTRVLP